MPVGSARSPLTVTLTVWKALFLREVLARVAQDRFGWIWVVVEPAAHVALLMAMFTLGFRTKVIAGVEVGVFIMLGVLGFFLARNMMTRCMDAIAANEALYAFRQIKPVDSVIARAGTEALLVCVVLMLMLLGAGLFGLPVVPVDPLGALAALGALGLAGLGLGLTLSVLGGLVDELGRVLRLLTTPLYFLSAVMYPSVILPPAVREVLLYNPLVHGVESLRLAFMQGYLAPPEIDLLYLVKFGVVLVFLGLALHIRFRNALVTE